MRWFAWGLVLVAMPCGCLLTIDDQKLDPTDGSTEAGHMHTDASDAHRPDATGMHADANDAHLADAHHGDGSPGTEAGGHDGGHDASSPLAVVCRAIADFVVTASSSSQISLSWTGAPGVTIEVERKTFCGSDNYVPLATLDAGATSYTDTMTVQANYNYWYEIVASDGDAGAASVLATQASSDPVNKCAGGKAPQPSGVDGGQCAVDGGAGPRDAGLKDAAGE